MHAHDCRCYDCRDIFGRIGEIERKIHKIVSDIRLLFNLVRILERKIIKLERLPVKGIFTQGAHMVTGTITGLLPGQTDSFFVTPVDVNGNADALPSGSPVPTITADDATVTVVTAADGLSAQVTAAAGATPGSSFNLNWAASYTDPSGNLVNIAAKANVPILTPPALLPVGGVFNQGSPALAKAAAAGKK